MAHQLEQLNIYSLSVFGESVQQASKGLTVKEGHGKQQHMVQQPGVHLLRRTVTAPYSDNVTQNAGQHNREGEGDVDLEVMGSGLWMS